MKSEVGPMCRGRMHFGRWRSLGLRRTRVRTSFAHRENLHTSLKITERHSTIQSTFSRHQSSRACRYSQWSLVTQQWQHVPGFLPWMLFGRPPLTSVLHGRPQPIYRYGNVPQITAESSDTPPIRYAQHVQQSVDMYIQLPADLQCDSVQIAEVVQQDYVPVSGIWLYPRVNVANTVHLSRITVTACRVKKEGAKTGLLSAIWLSMTMTNESLTLQPLSMHILYPDANEHSPWRCCSFFFLAVYIWKWRAYKIWM